VSYKISTRLHSSQFPDVILSVRWIRWIRWILKTFAQSKGSFSLAAVPFGRDSENTMEYPKVSSTYIRYHVRYQRRDHIRDHIKCHIRYLDGNLGIFRKGTICQEVARNAAKVKALLVPTRGYQMWLLDC